MEIKFFTNPQQKYKKRSTLETVEYDPRTNLDLPSHAGASSQHQKRLKVERTHIRKYME
jgi:hypothetical protein